MILVLVIIAVALICIAENSTARTRMLEDRWEELHDRHNYDDESEG